MRFCRQRYLAWPSGCNTGLIASHVSVPEAACPTLCLLAGKAAAAEATGSATRFLLLPGKAAGAREPLDPPTYSGMATNENATSRTIVQFAVFRRHLYIFTGHITQRTLQWPQILLKPGFPQSWTALPGTKYFGVGGPSCPCSSKHVPSYSQHPTGQERTRASSLLACLNSNAMPAAAAKVWPGFMASHISAHDTTNGVSQKSRPATEGTNKQRMIHRHGRCLLLPD